MKYTLKRDIVWRESLLTADHAATLLLLGGDGHQVAVPAPLLLAASPLVRSILADHLPPTYSPCFLSLPFATQDVLQDVKNILATGEADDVHENRIEEVSKVFETLSVKAVLISCPTKSTDIGLVLDSEVEHMTDEDSVRNETMWTVCLEKVPPPSQKNKLPISTSVNSSGFKEGNDVAGAGFKIKIEADVVHLLNDCVPNKEDVLKCDKCKYICYDRAELKTHQLAGHGRKIKYLCQNCPYACSNKKLMNNHCKNSGHKFSTDAAVVLKQRDSTGRRVIKAKAVVLKQKCVDNGNVSRSSMIDPSTDMPMQGAGDGESKDHVSLLELKLDNVMRDEEGRWICSECDLTTKSRFCIREHIESKHLSRTSFYLCPLCNKVSKTSAGLRVHKFRYHKTDRQIVKFGYFVKS